MRFFDRLKLLDPRIKIGVGVLCLLLGILALVTPLTPGSWLIFVGLELLGVRILAGRRIAEWFRRRREDNPHDTIDTQ